MAAPDHGRSDAHEVVAEALIRLRGDLERMIRRRFPALDAADVYQRAAVRALERCASLRELERVDAWLRRLVTTSAIDLIREGRGEILTDTHDVEATGTIPGASEDVCGCTTALMRSLPASYADIIRRVDVDGAGLAEVAGSLNIATGNATVRLHRARRALRTRLRDHCGAETMRQCLSCACDERGGETT